METRGRRSGDALHDRDHSALSGPELDELLGILNQAVRESPPSFQHRKFRRSVLLRVPPHVFVVRFFIVVVLCVECFAFFVFVFFLYRRGREGGGGAGEGKEAREGRERE